MFRIAAIAMLAACSGLEELETGICGNGILEPENAEDCDGSEFCDPDCRIVCDFSQLGLVDDVELCHGFEGYLCGLDNHCNAPSGTVNAFDQTDSLAKEIRIANINGVGLEGEGPEIVAIGSTSITTYLNFAVNGFAQKQTITTPTIQGAFMSREFGVGDAFTIVIPTTDGLVDYSSRFGTLAAEPFPADLAGGQPTLAMVGIEASDPQKQGEPDHIGVFQSENGLLSFEVIDTESGPIASTTDICGSIEAGFFDRNQFDTYTIVSAPDRLEMVFVLLLGSQDLCAFTLIRSGDQYTFTPLVLPVLPAQATVPILVDLVTDASPCPALVLRGATSYEYLPSQLATTCELGTTPRPLAIRGLSGDTRAVGRLRLEPPIAGAGPDALVLDNGIFKILADDSGDAIFVSDRTITDVVGTDLDLDGRLDALLVGSFTTDFDVLFRAPSLGAVDGFLPVRVATEGIPTALVPGDFDGNGLPDIAFIELFGFQRLMIAFGTPDRLLDPVHMASFDEVISIAPTQVRDNGDPTEIVLDLVVVDSFGASTRVTGLHGSASRTMIPIFNPGELGQGERFHAVVAGDLDNNGVLDLLAIDNTGSGGMWRLLGQDTGELVIDENPIASPIGSCSDDTAPLCTDARYLIHDRKVIAIDTSGRLAIFDLPLCPVGPAHCATVTSRDLAALANETLPATIVPRTPFVFDRDGGGPSPAEIILAFTTVSSLGGAVLICDAQLTSCESVKNIVGGSMTSCSDAGAGVFGTGGRGLPAPAPELVALCTSDSGTLLYRITDRDGVRSAEAIDGLSPGSEVSVSIQIGDVTGDRLDDVVMTDNFTLTVHRQLASRELASRPEPTKDQP